MATLANAIVKLIADTAGFESDMQSAIAQSSKTGKEMQKIGGQMQSMGAGMTAGVTAPIVAAGFAATQVASDFEETLSKTNVVFGENANAIFEWGQDSASAMGMSTQEALGAAATYGNLMTSMGMTQEQSAQMSTSLVGLAGDLASFNNMNPAEVLDKLRAGLTGETEPLKQLGVNMNQAALEAKAMEMGLLSVDTTNKKYIDTLAEMNKAKEAVNKIITEGGTGTKEYQDALTKLGDATVAYEDAMAGAAQPMDAATKAQAAYALIMEQTANAQGDFARTSDGLANQQRIVQASFMDMAATLGRELLPIGLEIVKFLNELMMKFQQLSPEQRKAILIFAGIAAAIGPILVVVGTIVSAIGTLMPVFTAIGGAIAAISAPVWGIAAAVIAVIALIALAWTNDWGGIQGKTAAVWEWLQTTAGTVMQFLQDLFGGKLGWLSELWANTWNSVVAVFDWIVAQFKLYFQLISAVFDGDWRKVGEILRQMWDNTFTMLKTVFGNGLKNLMIILVDFPKNVFEFFKKVNWSELGKNILLGIVNGLNASVKFVIDSAQAIGQAILDVFKGFFGIQSPSKLMKMQVGYQLSAGIAEGIGAGADALLPAGVNAVNGKLGSFGAAGGRGGLGGVVINVNVNGSGMNDQELGRKIGQSVRLALRQEGLV